MAEPDLEHAAHVAQGVAGVGGEVQQHLVQLGGVARTPPVRLRSARISMSGGRWRATGAAPPGDADQVEAWRRDSPWRLNGGSAAPGRARGGRPRATARGSGGRAVGRDAWRASSMQPMIACRMLLKSWAMPPARVPRVSSFCAWRSWASRRRRGLLGPGALRDVAGVDRCRVGPPLAAGAGRWPRGSASRRSARMRRSAGWLAVRASACSSSSRPRLVVRVGQLERARGPPRRPSSRAHAGARGSRSGCGRRGQHPDQVVGVLDQRAELLLAVPQRLLGPAALDDVPQVRSARAAMWGISAKVTSDFTT